MRTKLKQSQRALALLLDILILLVISYYTFGHLIPPFGGKGFWFYTALLSILVGTKLLTPFYVKPVDAVAYTVPAFVALMLVNSWTSWATNAQVTYIVALTLTALIGISAFAALILNGWGVKSMQEISNRLRLLLEEIARPPVIFAPIMIFAMFAFHYDSPNELVAVSIAMLLTTTFSIGNLLIRAFGKFRLTLLRVQPLGEFGTVAAYQKPGVYLLRTNALDERKLPAPIIVNDELIGLRFAYAIDTVGRENGHLCRAIDLGKASDPSLLQAVNGLPSNTAIELEEVVLNASELSTRILYNGAQSIAGLVAPDTTVSRLYFEITQNDGLAIGRLVSVEFYGQKVLYQLVAGLTREEAVHQKNTYGYLRAQAQQIGTWKDSKFVQCKWLPEMHTPVKLEKEETYKINTRAIGRLPQTNYTAEIEDIHQLVTHNTAILGILGVGKSMLAIELVERMITQRIKVICLDLTSQYANELKDFYCEEIEAESLRRIQAACVQDRDASEDNPEEGGSLPNLKQAIFEDLTNFLSDDNPQMLKIYNPSDFTATRQESEPRSYMVKGQWHRGAGLYRVTPVQATQIISEAALDCVSDRMSDLARVCLVYEEAHALVPEWNSVVVEGDKRATSGSARAILQGRKYGLGCLLVTQRTANVTKTILNQCNTIFAMRTFDETGKEFLSNYLGHDYADELSSMAERHAVFFGRASNCENPVLIALNDRDEFRETFRNLFPPPAKNEICGNVDKIASEENVLTVPDNDDIPF